MSGYDDDEPAYNDKNRAFLQAFISRSTLTFDEAKPIMAAIFTAYDIRETQPEDITEADFATYISTANQAISPFDLEIRGNYHQTTRLRVYALVNCAGDPIAQLATSYTPDEIGFLKRVLDAMFEGPNNSGRREVMAVSGMEAVRLCKPPGGRERRETQGGSDTQGSAGMGLTMVQAEKMLKALVEQEWLEKSRKGYYSLSPRALMELRGWLLETYNEEDEDGEGLVMKVKLCYACKDIVTVGQRCPKQSCPCRIHDICTQNFFRVQRSKVCPLCKTDWTEENFVGERAASGTTKTTRKSRGTLRANVSTQPVEPVEVDTQGEPEEKSEENDDDLYS